MTPADFSDMGGGGGGGGLYSDVRNKKIVLHHINEIK